MSRLDRVKLIRQIEGIRGSTVICYLTSLRPNVPSQMSDDAVRVTFDHLLRLPARPVRKLDIFLCSNGGSGTVPWRLVSLFREFATSFGVLVPYRAYSAASLIALGADEIVMHPFAELGPIDPTVSNDFNPVEQGTGKRLGISVEDVSAYINFVKSGVGISHEDELVKAVEILANKVHPLALGNVERFLSQSRMIAKKILRTHMKDADEHAIKEIVENMASKLYFHGHPINRQEAKDDLKLKVTTDISPELEAAMWSLYLDYEEEFENLSVFNPAGDLAAMSGTPPMVPATPPAPHAPVPTPPGQPQPAPLPAQTPPAQPQAAPSPPQTPPAVPQTIPLVLPGTPGHPPNLPAFLQAMQLPQALQAPKVKTYTLLHAIVESTPLLSRFTTERRYQSLTGLPGLPPGQVAIQEEMLSQGWSHSEEASEETPSQPSLREPADAQEETRTPPARRTRKSQPPKE
jgi:hypothetical protein